MAAKDEGETDIESAFEVTDTHDANISDIPIIPGRGQLAQSEDDGEIKKGEVCGHQIERLIEMAGHVVANKEEDRKEKKDFQSFLKEDETQKPLMKIDVERMQIAERESEFEITDTHDVNISDDLTKFWQSEDDGKIEEERLTEMTGNVASVIEEGRKEKDAFQRFYKEGDGRKPVLKANATYKERKNDLKRYLITNYIANFQPDTLPEVDRLYAEPSMELVTDCFLETDDVDIFRENTDTNSVDGDIKINDVFFNGQKKCHRICISGKTGLGKTALCKMLSLAWCQVHSSKTISEHIPDDFKNVMEKFDILFFIALNDYKIGFNGIRVIKDLYFEDKCFFKLFKKNECDNSSILVIIDGNESMGQPQFPDLTKFRGFTTLITTRPQKLYAMRMWSPEIDRNIKLTYISTGASDKYIDSMVDMLNKKNNVTKDSLFFKLKMLDKHLQHFLNIPIILKQMIILWHHDEDEITDRSHVHLYSAMTNRLLLDVVEKNKNISLRGGSSQLKDPPVCLKKRKCCYIYKDLLLSLSHFAFTNMFNVHLPFCTWKQKLTEDDEKACLAAGLLCLDDNGLVSFLHKSFQDFLATVYLVMNRQLDHSLLSSSTTQDILNMRSLFIFACGMDSDMLSLLYNLLKEKKKTCQLLEPTQDLICECIKASENIFHSQLSFHLEDVIIVSEWENTDWRWDYLSQCINDHPSSIKTLHVYYYGNPSATFYQCIKLVLRKCRSVGHVTLVLWEKLSLDIEAMLGEAFHCLWSSSSLKVFGEVPNVLIPYIDGESDDQDETMIDQLQRNGKPFPKKANLTDLLLRNYNTNSILSVISEHIKSLSKNILKVRACYNHEDINNIVFLIIHEDKIESDVQKKLQKYNVFYRKNRYVSSERRDVLFRKEILSKEEDEKVRKCIAKEADKLFKKYSNITMILPNNVKSVGYGKKHKLLDETCIVLFVPVKGLIPVSEEPFPTMIGNYPTDVMEGTLSFFVHTSTERHDNIKVGCQITSQIEKIGTVGPIIRLLDGKYAFITCAHVVCNVESGDSDSSKGTPIYQPDKSNYSNLIGHVLDSIIHCKMEIAVVKLDSRWPGRTGTFPESSVCVKENGFCSSNVSYSGEYCKNAEDVEVGTKVYMFGSESGATKGILRNLSIESNPGIILKEQLAITDMSRYTPFALKGDSGATVYVKKSNGDFKILGILVAGDLDFYVVTPIWNVCKELTDLKVGELLQFEQNENEISLREEITNLKFRVASTENQICYRRITPENDIENQICYRRITPENDIEMEDSNN